ncbi:Protein of unknown function [Desulfonauticus submarinus]|uniref:Uncharacterized protein n=1 Tax=Desulfonauticus submarinus TaxID=206665 RepID=A0A1G9ZUL1_9BACT|nr:DUF3540 domain-containing protein [Desulfonauticus submarinus]SDN25322.1 Protein of unknown function [Desulfonauticus submarinus]
MFDVSVLNKQKFEEGMVLKQESDSEFLIQTDNGIYRAYLTPGCFLVPNVYDKVILFHGSESYIVHVLSHESVEKKLNIPYINYSIKNDIVSIKCKNLEIESEDINIRSFKKLYLVANIIEQKGKNLFLKFEKIEFHVKELLKFLESSVEWISKFKITNAKRIKYLVSNLLWIKSKNLIMLARQKVKIDGDKINLG